VKIFLTKKKHPMTWIHEKEKCGNSVIHAFIIDEAEKTGKFKRKKCRM